MIKLCRQYVLHFHQKDVTVQCGGRIDVRSKFPNALDLTQYIVQQTSLHMFYEQ